tara:strand:+ start:186 stop:425 length:240 start_codon:yes stop_codon:yes gene_type:complete
MAVAAVAAEVRMLRQVVAVAEHLLFLQVKLVEQEIDKLGHQILSPQMMVLHKEILEGIVTHVVVVPVAVVLVVLVLDLR